MKVILENWRAYLEEAENSIDSIQVDEGFMSKAKAFFERMKLDNLDQAKMLVEVDIKKRDVKEVVNEWLDNNPDKWKSWLPN